jgi:hypothetical protein
VTCARERRVALIKGYRKGGKSLAELGKPYGLSKQSVFGILVRAGEIHALPVGGDRQPGEGRVMSATAERHAATVGSQRLLEAYIAYFRKHVWGKVA